MALKDYCFDGSKKLELSQLPTDGKKDGADKAAILKKTEKNLAKMAELQDRLYADSRESVVLVLQAMDAAGKDSTVKHVMSGINPQGVNVVSFKQPSGEELAHDYLWRAVRALPRRGSMGIFNRSYYEDVLVVRVHKLYQNYAMAKRVLNDSEDEFFGKRYRQIRDFEEYLYENSYRLVKVFLHVSPEEQKKRFLERIDDPAKNWKFSAGDVDERALWNDYMDAYEKAINATAAPHSPWYVLPADQKWYTRYLVSEALVQALEACEPRYPVLPRPEHEQLADCKARLLAEEKDRPGSVKKDARAAAPAEDAAEKADGSAAKDAKAAKAGNAGKKARTGKKSADAAAKGAAPAAEKAAAKAAEKSAVKAAKATAAPAAAPKRRGRPPKAAKA